MTPVYVKSEDNIADIFTKVLLAPVFERLRDIIMPRRHPAASGGVRHGTKEVNFVGSHGIYMAYCL